MKVLSLQQPYATLVQLGVKMIETRSWAPRWRGPIALHASKGLSTDGARAVREIPAIAAALREAGYATLGDLPCGAIIGVCELYDVVPVETITQWADVYLRDDERALGDYRPGRYGLLLDNVRPLPRPIPARGALGLWDFDPSLAHEPALERAAEDLMRDLRALDAEVTGLKPVACAV